jgi:hypothetical protein
MENDNKVPAVCTFIGSRREALKRTWKKMKEIGLDRATNEDFKKAIREAWKETKLEIAKCK